MTVCLAQFSRRLLLVAIALVPSSTRADISGFGSFADWEVNQVDSGAAPGLGANSIRLTTRGGSVQGRSIFHTLPQVITGPFTASFTYRTADLLGSGYGGTFVLQNDDRGSDAVGGTSGSLGYTGIRNSVAISLELGNGIVPRSGLYFDGSIGGGAPSLGSVNLFSGNPIDVTITYDGDQLHVDYLDTITSASVSEAHSVDLPSVLGGPNAFVGFTASTGGSGSAEQHFSNFQFSTVPEPSSIVLLAAGGGALAVRRWRRRFSTVGRS
jgi:hypothetical protein